MAARCLASLQVFWYGRKAYCASAFVLFKVDVAFKSAGYLQCNTEQGACLCSRCPPFGHAIKCGTCCFSSSLLFNYTHFVKSIHW